MSVTTVTPLSISARTTSGTDSTAARLVLTKRGMTALRSRSHPPSFVS